MEAVALLTPPEKDTVSTHFVRAALARLKGAGRQRALAAAGIAPELADVAHARVTAEAFSALWLAVAVELDDEFFGLDRRRMKVGSFALLTQAVLPCATLDRALRRTLRGFAVLLDDVSGTLRVDGGEAVVEVDNRIAEGAARRFADETFLIMVHGLMCWLTGQRLPLRGADFAHDRPAHAAEYALMYSEHLRFAAPRTALRFDAALLDAPVVQNAQTLRVFLRTAPQSVFLKYRNLDSWTARVRRRLRAHLGSGDWPRLADVAAAFQVAPTTLRRRLEAEGASYQGIKDALRRDAAIHHLGEAELGMAEIASRLGFQEPGAFRRAFRKWTGVQPGQYRRAARADGGLADGPAVLPG